MFTYSVRDNLKKMLTDLEILLLLKKLFLIDGLELYVDTMDLWPIIISKQ